MLLLLPKVHRLLVLLPALQVKVVDESEVRNISIFFKSRSDRLPDVLRRDTQAVQGNDFGSLSQTLVRIGRT